MATTTRRSLVSAHEIETTADYAPNLSTPKRNPSSTNGRAKWSKIAWAIFGVLFFAYSLAAFIIDFKRAKALFWIEVAAAVIALGNFFKAPIGKTFTSVESVCGNAWSKKPVRIGSYVIVCAAVVALLIVAVVGEWERIISALGLVSFIGFSYLFSWERKSVCWRPVLWGIGLQLVFALLILRTDAGFSAFEFLGDQVSILLKYTNAGSKFVFGDDLVNNFVFAFAILPTVVFFSCIVSILYYLGAIQVVIKVIAKVMAYTLGTSGSESVNAAGNIFIGQTEAPLLIRPFLKDMTRSELHAVMTGGFATVAGGVLAAYVMFGVSASHLLAASVMSAPAALAISKLIYPETEESVSADGNEYEIESGNETNVIEAASNGAIVAIQLALNIGGMLIAFLALLAALDAWVNYFGTLVGYHDASFRGIGSYFFAPIAWLMGVPYSDCRAVGELLALKVFANEFIAYQAMMKMKKHLTERAITISTYALCGFSNLGSIGIQLGGLTPLAPHRSKDLAEIVFSAMIAGNLACFMTACIAGLLID